MNPRIGKINEEIEKLSGKVSSMQGRLKELERLKIEIENADIIAMVRGVNLAPSELAEFARMVEARKNCAVPDTHEAHNKKEDSTIEE